MRIVHPASVLAAILLPSCAIHPLPEDVTGAPVVAIVERIRCEARDALKAALIEELLEKRISQDLGLALQRGTLSVQDFRDKHLTPLGHPGIDAQSFERIKSIGGSAIAYEFTFKMTEDNDGKIDAEFKDPLTNGMLTLKLTGGNQRQRHTDKRFLVSDDFDDLLIDMTDDDCSGTPQNGNWVYPIVGRIGLDKTVTAFLELQNRIGLGIDEEDRDFAKGDFIEELTFETVFSATATPSVVLTPAGSDFRLTGASLGPSATRTDIHTVKISLRVGELQLAGRTLTAEQAAVESLQAERYRSTQQQILDLLE